MKQRSPTETSHEDVVLPGMFPILEAGHTFGTITEKISSIVVRRGTPLWWLLGFAVTFGITNVMLIAIAWLFFKGIGVWGVNIPVAWGFAIVNFVWWIGIGHAGTLISAILYLLKQSWRNSINRFAEAMTLFAVMCAGLFPVLHTGRPWLAYWLFPIPLTMGVWPQFRSPLIWDVFAVSTYFTVSLLFWYVGLVPDLASIRDHAPKRWQRTVYGVLAMGWRGSARHWKRYESAYLILAGLATPLVLSVHTVVSFDFAIAILPGWHTTIFPPYFVAGAIYSGFAMVLVLAIPIRSFYGLKDMITMRHLENSAKLLLATGWIVAYGYAMEAFMSWWSNNQYEWFLTRNRLFGPYHWWYWALISCNILIPQVLWSKKVRTNIIGLFLVSVDILIGMWLERFVIVIVSLHRDFVPSAWGHYKPTAIDWTVLVGTLGFFTMCMLLFLRFLPSISISEMKILLPEAEVQHPEEMHV